MGNMLISKNGIDIKNATPKDFALNIDYTTMKAALSGTLEVNLPAETITAGGGLVIREYTDAVDHGLNRVPICFPFLETLYLNSRSGTDILLNEQPQSPTSTKESATILITDSELTLLVQRLAVIVDETFTAHKVTLYYTLFWNDITDEFNFL